MAGRRLDDLELRAWQALLHAHHDVVGVLDRELQAEHGLSFSEYDVLLRLARARESGLRMAELADRVLLSPSGLTRLVDRLEARGVVARRPDPEDRRVTFAALTDPGLGLLREAARTHVRGIRQHFTSRMTRAQLQAVAEALEGVAGPHDPH